MEREADAVISDAILRKVVGSDLFAAVAGANHATALGAHGGLLFLKLHLIEPGAEDAFGLGAILDLRFFILAGNHQAGGQVSEPDRGVRRVDGLPSGT